MDIYKEEKFDKGGIVLERIHPDLQVEPYVPYYERMGYVVSIVEKPNGWVELIGEKKDTFEDAYGRFKKDIRENTSPSKMARGGRTKIENDGVDFNEQMYRGILGDKDKDGTENADDVEPNNPNVSQNIEGTKFTDTFRTLLDDKRTYDDSMYSIIGEMEKILPQKFDIIARTKTPFSILKKLVEKRLKFKRNEEGKVTNKGLTDVVGTTIATNNTKELMTLRKMIGVDNGDNGIFGEVIEVDDKFKIPACGYRAIHYIVLYNGVPVEIQLKTKRMKMLNEFSHPYYKAGDLDCDGMGELAEIVVMADNGSKEAQKEFADIFADKDRMRSMISKSYARGGEVEWFDYSKIDLMELPYDLDRYFIKDADTKEIDLNLLEPTRAREKGVKNANKYMRMAYDGEIDRRKPISVYERNGEMFVFDGNSTIANAKNSGWKTIYVEMIDDPNDDFERGGEVYDETKYNANEEIISTKKTNISNIDTRLKPFLKDKERFKVEIKRDKQFNIVKVEVYQKNFNKWRLFKTYINKKEFARGGEVSLNEDMKAESYVKSVIKYSDFYELGDGYSSRFKNATNKKGDKTNGEYTLEGKQIFWTYIDNNGREYSSNEQPAIRLDMRDYIKKN